MTPVTAADLAASERIQAENDAKEKREGGHVPRRQQGGKRVAVYVCPTPGCPDYYGTGGMPALEERIVGQRGQNFEPRPESQWHSRAECPTCRAGGKKVERIRVELFVPAEALVVADAA
jgi:hypothetical protein